MNGMTFYGGRRILMAPENDAGGGTGDPGKESVPSPAGDSDWKAELAKLSERLDQQSQQSQAVGQSVTQLVEFLQNQNARPAPAVDLPDLDENEEVPGIKSLRQEFQNTTRTLLAVAARSDDRADRLEFQEFAKRSGMVDKEIQRAEVAYQGFKKQGLINPITQAQYTRIDAAAAIRGYESFGTQIEGHKKLAEEEAKRREANRDASLETGSRSMSVSEDPEFEKLAGNDQLKAIKANLDKHKF